MTLTGVGGDEGPEEGALLKLGVLEGDEEGVQLTVGSEQRFPSSIVPST